MPSPWREAPVVTLYVKVCPYDGCGSMRFIQAWTKDNGDDTKSAHQICERCNRPVVWEIVPHPRGGDLVTWPLSEFESLED